MKVAFLSGRQENGTMLPKNERFVWKELIRILEDEIKNPVFKGATFLIPIYNKFDLYVLYLAERNNIKVEYYVPQENWGLSGLPKHQTYLVERMSYPRHVIKDGDRLKAMVDAADVVYVLPETSGFERFEPWLDGKIVCRFPVEKMLYKTEAEAERYHEQLNQQTQMFVNAQQVQSLQHAQMEKSAFDELNRQFGQGSLFNLGEDSLPY